MAPKKLAGQIEQLWSSPEDQERMIQSFDRVRERLGPRGAAARAAEEIISIL
jgi:lipid A disaccharide synthetase